MTFRDNLLLRRSQDVIRAGKTRGVSGRGRLATIVVAEPDPSDLQLISDFLSDLGYRVVTARDGETAFRLAVMYRAALVLAVLRLPSLDGLSLGRKLRDLPVEIPIILISDPGEIPDQVLGQESFAHDYIQKPIVHAELESRISGLLRFKLDEPRPPVMKRRPTSPPPARTEPEAAAPPGRALGRPTQSLLEGILSRYRRPIETSESDSPAERVASESSVESDAHDDLEQMVRRLTASGERAETGGGERVAETEGPLVDRITREEFSQFLSETLSSQDQFALERLIGAEKTPFYADLATYVLGCIRGAEAGQPIDVDRGVWLAEGIVRFVDQGPDLLLAATDREQEFSVTGHSVNVAILAARLGYTLRLPSDVRARVGATALLHEVGVVRLPKRLVHKPEKIAKEELQTMRSRPQLSALILREGGDAPDWLAETVEQVFERENGSGFPRGLSSKDIREEAKLLAGADVFEACIHNRPYRKALTGYQSLLELTTEGSKSLAEKVVKALIRCFSLYPYNELVVLNTGEIGKVINVHEGNISRPVVEILFDGRGRPVSEGKVTDLAQNSSLYITRVTVADQLPAVDASIEE